LRGKEELLPPLHHWREREGETDVHTLTITGERKEEAGSKSKYMSYHMKKTFQQFKAGLTYGSHVASVPRDSCRYSIVCPRVFSGNSIICPKRLSRYSIVCPRGLSTYSTVFTRGLSRSNIVCPRGLSRYISIVCPSGLSKMLPEQKRSCHQMRSHDAHTVVVNLIINHLVA